MQYQLIFFEREFYLELHVSDSSDASYSSLPSPLQSELCRALEGSVLRMSAKELGNTVYGLVSQMGLSYPAMPLSLRGAFYEAFESAASAASSIKTRGAHQRMHWKVFDKQSLTAVLQSMTKADRYSGGSPLSWSDLPSSLQESIIFSSNRLLSADHSGDLKLLSDTLQSLGRLGAAWTRDLPRAFRALAFLLLDRALPEGRPATAMQSSSVASALNGIAKLCFNGRADNVVLREGWASSLSILEQATCAALLVKYAPVMSPNDIASVFWALGSLDVRYVDLPQELSSTCVDNFHRTMPRMQSSEFIWTLHASSKMGLQYSTFSILVQEEIMSSTNKIVGTLEDSISNLGLLLWALTSIKAPINEFPESTREVFVGAVGTVLDKRDTNILS